MTINIMEIGVILPAYKIPDKSIVTRKNEMYQYILENKQKTIIIDDRRKGIVTLTDINRSTSITSLLDDTILVWVTTENEYYEHLTKKRKGIVL